MKDQKLDFGSVQIHVREYPLNGETIIFLHFGGSNLLCWERVVPYFTDDYHVVTLDLRGHGLSSRPESGYHIDDMADDVSRVMVQLDIDQAHIVGCSLGAEVGVSLAANYPNVVRSLSCDGALFNEFGPYGHYEGSAEEYKAYVAERLQKMENKPVTTYPTIEERVKAEKDVLEQYGWWNEWVEAMTRCDAILTSDGQYTSAWSKPLSLEYTRYLPELHFEDYYGRIKCPVMLLPDDGDMGNPKLKAAVEGQISFAENGRLTVAEGWMHPYGWLLEPEPMVKRIRAFLEDIRNDLRNKFLTSLKRLEGQKCWGYVGGIPTGSIINVQFGKKYNDGIRRKKDGEIMYKSQYSLFIHSPWRIEKDGRIICNWGDDNQEGGPMLAGLDNLVDQVCESVEIYEPGFDLTLHFSNNIVFKVFTIEEDDTPDVNNYTYFFDNRSISVGIRGSLSTELNEKEIDWESIE